MQTVLFRDHVLSIFIKFSSDYIALYQRNVFKMHSTAWVAQWVTCRQCLGLQCDCELVALTWRQASENKDDALRMATRSKAQLPKLPHDDRESVLNYFFILKRTTRLQPRKLSEAALLLKKVLIFMLKLFSSKGLLAASTSKSPTAECLQQKRSDLEMLSRQLAKPDFKLLS